MIAWTAERKGEVRHSAARGSLMGVSGMEWRSIRRMGNHYADNLMTVGRRLLFNDCEA